MADSEDGELPIAVKGELRSREVDLDSIMLKSHPKQHSTHQAVQRFSPGLIYLEGLEMMAGRRDHDHVVRLNKWRWGVEGVARGAKLEGTTFEFTFKIAGQLTHHLTRRYGFCIFKLLLGPPCVLPGRGAAVGTKVFLRFDKIIWTFVGLPVVRLELPNARRALTPNKAIAVDWHAYRDFYLHLVHIATLDANLDWIGNGLSVWCRSIYHDVED
jgi:hypothetical protein